MHQKLKLLFTCITIILSSSAWLNLMSQGIALKQGLYPSFYSFLNQSPLPGINVTLKNIEQHDETWIGETKIQIKPSKKMRRRELNSIKKIMWGFYDGTALYINSNNYAKKPPSANSTYINGQLDARYSKILFLGMRYSYFEGVKPLSDESGNLLGGLIGTIPISNYCILDMSNGEVYPMNKNVIEELLKEDKDLHTQFKEDKKKKDNLLLYIEEFNKRNS